MKKQKMAEAIEKITRTNNTVWYKPVEELMKMKSAEIVKKFIWAIEIYTK